MLKQYKSYCYVWKLYGLLNVECWMFINKSEPIGIGWLWSGISWVWEATKKGNKT